ncbi:hypothetical protein OPV22_014207 [Ensete ventricosum]|uniref:Uncharacterized protein n=1 Tax=Ensete ventricosum TaxID=4639 RepID=A0AAV8R5K3_ENSVE|nr:hypothetical protein OPV22_014207 [Ensete ventricosum]
MLSMVLRSELFLAMSLMETAKESLGLSRTVLLNFLQRDVWESTASSMVAAGVRFICYFTASEHSPQIHLPWKNSLIRRMYVGVQSSDMPQHSHSALSTSFAVAFSFNSSIILMAFIIGTPDESA